MTDLKQRFADALDDYGVLRETLGADKASPFHVDTRYTLIELNKARAALLALFDEALASAPDDRVSYEQTEDGLVFHCKTSRGDDLSIVVTPNDEIAWRAMSHGELKAASDEKPIYSRQYEPVSFDESRADVIGQNGNDGLHYVEADAGPTPLRGRITRRET